MKFIYTTLLLMISSSAIANIIKAPNSFISDEAKAIYIDIQSISTKIIYDVSAETAKAQSTIEFITFETGMPIFDLVPEASLIKINGTIATSKKISSPGNTTTYRLLEHRLNPGAHTLYIENDFDTNIKFIKGWFSSEKSVRTAFWMSDLTDRRYMEQYIPTNLEFDQYKQSLEIKVLNATTKHEVYTNGSLLKIANNHFKIDFPEYFTTSSFYFHMTEENHYPSIKFNFTSINGSIIPVSIYTASGSELSSLKTLTIKTLKELESKLGAWSHPSLTIYKAGQGGMEHSGATITSRSALGHELTHSYFARGVMPVDGNSGWMDEAIASWRDKGYKAVEAPNFSSTQMSGHSEYTRTTDRKAYTQGANFMAYLNFELKEIGGLTAFLSKMYKQYTHKSIDTNLFKKELDLFSGRDFSAEFNQYIFGLSHVNEGEDKHMPTHNPYHPKLTKKQLLDLL